MNIIRFVQLILRCVILYTRKLSIYSELRRRKQLYISLLIVELYSVWFLPKIIELLIELKLIFNLTEEFGRLI